MSMPVAAQIVAAGMTPIAFNDGIYYNSNTSGGEFSKDICRQLLDDRLDWLHPGTCKLYCR